MPIRPATAPTQAPKRSNYDVVIVGGAIYGAAVSWFLADNADFAGTILVVERDPSYAACSTTHTNSCMRQQFSNPLNVRISRFAAEFVKNFRAYLGGDPRVPDLTFHSFGYMYLAADEAAAAALRASQRMQSAHGATTKHLTADEIKRDYPFYNTDDIVGGNHNLVDEGYFDGGTLFDWWRKSGREKGVEYIGNEVADMQLNAAANRVASVKLKSGETVNCGTVVNASGPRAVLTARMAGLEIPVEPRKRYTFVFAAQQPLERDLPLTVDPTGVHMRSDGAHYLAGCAPDDDRAVDYDDYEQDADIWLEKVWPALAARVPRFSAIKLINSWAGHYAFNTFDQNAIVGPHPAVENFIFVNGFSGHGLQQSPAMGRGIAEFITYGEYRSLDLSPFHFDRIARGEKFDEKAII